MLTDGRTDMTKVIGVLLRLWESAEKFKLHYGRRYSKGLVANNGTLPKNIACYSLRIFREAACAKSALEIVFM